MNLVTVGGRREGRRRLGLRLLVSRRDDDVRMLRRLYRRLLLLLLLMRGLGMVRLTVQHPCWYRWWRQLLILHRAAHPITSRAHLIALTFPRGPPLRPPADGGVHSADNESPRATFLSLVSALATRSCPRRRSARGITGIYRDPTTDHRGCPSAFQQVRLQDREPLARSADRPRRKFPRQLGQVQHAIELS
jgi:hypothetical protein